MRTKRLYVLIHVRIKGGVGTVKQVYASKHFLLTIPRRFFFCGSFLLFMFVFVILSYPFLAVL